VAGRWRRRLGGMRAARRFDRHPSGAHQIPRQEPIEGALSRACTAEPTDVTDRQQTALVAPISAIRGARGAQTMLAGMASTASGADRGSEPRGPNLVTLEREPAGPCPAEPFMRGAFSPRYEASQAPRPPTAGCSAYPELAVTAWSPAMAPSLGERPEEVAQRVVMGSRPSTRAADEST
jgi:hypothetical protein